MGENAEKRGERLLNKDFLSNEVGKLSTTIVDGVGGL